METKPLSSTKNHASTTLSNNFKLWVVAFIFFLAFLHLYNIVAYPKTVIVPPEVLLGVVLFLTVYLWIKELGDRHHLLQINEALVEAQEGLQQAQVDTITALVLTEEAKDPYVRGHSKNVARYALAIAQEMNFPPEKLGIVYRAGILHDLGKLGIADAILHKEGPLDDAEWKIMRQHPQKAVDILKPLRFLSIEQKIILRHHEYYNGGGYPDGLKGENIPLESRILSAADTFDAMNSKRSYRRALTHDEILSELKKISGGQLDGQVVGVLLEMLKKDAGLWERET
jgi:putative nucleotidyltransferase with HDIG domain